MNDHDLENRFTFHSADAQRIELHAEVRDLCLRLARKLNVLVPESREQSLAITHLEEVMMWANAGIARHESPL